MLQRLLNLGILAHVDAGKTTLTERLLHLAGVIDEVGSVDEGTTQTDSLPLERQRGITIKSAVVSFAIDDLTVNLIDTPGHPDFIAEVERALSVLDGAVLVVSAVEGVQAQTRILMRALQRLRMPTLIFVNKLDRMGADPDAALQAITDRLNVPAVPMGVPHGVGTKETSVTPFGLDDAGFRSILLEALTAVNDRLLATYLDDEGRISSRALRAELVAQTRTAQAVPVFFGSAVTGAGADHLTSGVAELLPSANGDPDGPASGAVFKIERTTGGQRIAYVRVTSGTIHTRDHLHFGSAGEGKVTSLDVFAPGRALSQPSAPPGAVIKVSGLDSIQVGDVISGVGGHSDAQANFAAPAMEAVVTPEDVRERARLWVALTQLEEQDPLIAVRRSEGGREISVSLYGEVQKEVIATTLESEFGLRVSFRETTPICIERPLGTAEAAEILNAPTNPFAATLGLRVEPRPIDSGVDVDLDVSTSDIPLHLFKRVGDFRAAMAQYVRDALEEGLFGWRVTDCRVTVTTCGYGGSDGPPSKRGPAPTFKDFHRLTAIVLMRALSEAGTVVCQPVVRARFEVPEDTAATLRAALSRLGAATTSTEVHGPFAIVDAVLPIVDANALQRQLPRMTRGEGVLESAAAGFAPVIGSPPVRTRTSANPLNLKEYLNALS